MTYDRNIDKAVRDASEELSVGQIIFPLVNMIATTLANVVVQKGLDPEAELEPVRHQLDELYTRYLHAYRQAA